MYVCGYILIFNKSIKEYISVLYRYKLYFSRSMLTEACFIKTTKLVVGRLKKHFYIERLA